jgi:hypothetical protein
MPPGTQQMSCGTHNVPGLTDITQHCNTSLSRINHIKEHSRHTLIGHARHAQTASSNGTSHRRDAQEHPPNDNGLSDQSWHIKSPKVILSPTHELLRTSKPHGASRMQKRAQVLLRRSPQQDPTTRDTSHKAIRISTGNVIVDANFSCKFHLP